MKTIAFLLLSLSTFCNAQNPTTADITPRQSKYTINRVSDSLPYDHYAGLPDVESYITPSYPNHQHGFATFTVFGAVNQIGRGLKILDRIPIPDFISSKHFLPKCIGIYEVVRKGQSISSTWAYDYPLQSQLAFDSLVSEYKQLISGEYCDEYIDVEINFEESGKTLIMTFKEFKTVIFQMHP